MLKAATPGCGKSYICGGMVNLGYKVLFTCPIHKLVQTYEAANDKLISATINTLFYIRVGEETIKAFDYTDYNVFMVDEIYFSDMQVLNRIKRFIVSTTDKYYTATGDSEQLKPVS
jgi:hypothetical protein